MSITNAERRFLPAAGRDWFLPLYDPMTRILGVDSARRTLLEQAALQPQYRVLDVGCGTGSLAVLIKSLYPSVNVIGVDPDPKALGRAERKSARAGVDVRFDRSFADGLGYPDGTFDRVFSSMMFHHLEDGEKVGALREIRRVLRPGGRLELLDFLSPAHGHNPLGHLIHSHHRLKDNAENRILELITNAGFDGTRKLATRGLLFGLLGFFQATAPATRE